MFCKKIPTRYKKCFAKKLPRYDPKTMFSGIKKQPPYWMAVFMCWHLPIFPDRHQSSIFGTIELNFRVRHGNGWTLNVINTNCISSSLLTTYILYHCNLKKSRKFPEKLYTICIFENIFTDCKKNRAAVLMTALFFDRQTIKSNSDEIINFSFSL